jgi:hypothetical protein
MSAYEDSLRVLLELKETSMVYKAKPGLPHAVVILGNMRRRSSLTFRSPKW